MTSERRQRHNHPGIIVTVIACFAVMLATQGLVVRKAGNAAAEAKETAAIARDVTDPNCDTTRASCRAAQARQGGQGTVVADINDVSVIGAYCAQQHDELDAVRTCVGQEFTRLTGRPVAIATTTTTAPGG